jgi:hypothetical protein
MWPDFRTWSGHLLLRTTWSPKASKSGPRLKPTNNPVLVHEDLVAVGVKLPAIEHNMFGVDTASQDRYVEADLLSGMTFERGDFLFCVKDTATETCAPTDYKWLDTASDTLVSTRPTAPKQSSYLADREITCTDDNDDRYEFNLDLISMYATIPASQRFVLYGDFSHGELSNQWADATVPLGDGKPVEPDLIYSYTSPSGVTTEGTNLVVEIDFDPTSSMFIETFRATDIDANALEQSLEKLHFKTQWAFDKKTTPVLREPTAITSPA